MEALRKSLDFILDSNTISDFSDFVFLVPISNLQIREMFVFAG